MRAVVLENPAAAPTPVLKEIPVPQPAPGEVLVRIHAAALNHRDLYAVQGRFKRAMTDFIMAADGAGEIAALGEGVTGWQVGDPVVINPLLYCGTCPACLRGDHDHCVQVSVMGGPANGMLAEYVTAPARNLARKPEHLDFAAAAALPLAVATAWNVLFTKGGLKPGETVLIHGIGGGVALFALQIAAGIGCRAIVTSGSNEKLQRALAMGAAAGINYKEEDVLARVKSLAPEGVDLVVDGIGKETLAISFAAANAATGRIVSFGSASGTGTIETSRLNRTFLVGGMGSQAEFAEAMRFVANTRLEPAFEAPLPMERFREAIDCLADSRQFGKVVLAI